MKSDPSIVTVILPAARASSSRSSAAPTAPVKAPALCRNGFDGFLGKATGFDPLTGSLPVAVEPAARDLSKGINTRLHIGDGLSPLDSGGGLLP